MDLDRTPRCRVTSLPRISRLKKARTLASQVSSETRLHHHAMKCQHCNDFHIFLSPTQKLPRRQNEK